MKMKSFLLSLITMTLALSNAQAAEKIVSTAGYASEIVAELGRGDNLVGVDTTSIKPEAEMEKKPKIGYRRQLSAEGILSLKPDLIILAPDAGPQAVIDQIKASGIALLHLENKQSLEGIRDDIAQIAKTIGAETEAKLLTEKILADEQKLIALRNQHSADINALVLIDTPTQGVFGLGKDSAGEHFLSLLKLNNSFDAQGNKPLSREALAASKADIILLASRNQAKEAATIAKLPQTHTQYDQLLNTQAGKKGCIFTINILDALGFGPHTAHYAHQILSAIQPCLK